MIRISVSHQLAASSPADGRWLMGLIAAGAAVLEPGLSSLAALATANDQALRWFLHVARLHAFLLAPRAHHVPAATRTAAVWVIHRVHDFATHLGATALPARLARLAGREQLVLGVTHFANR